MGAGEALARGRGAFEREAWSEAYAQLLAADGHEPLEPDDLDRLATAAYLSGEDAASVDARGRAHFAFLERGQAIRAARSAFWLAFSILNVPSQQAQAGGWLARARRLIDERNEPCVEQGFLLCASGYLRTVENDLESAHVAFERAARIGDQFNDQELIALARHGEGRTLLRLERRAEGLAMLDEVMVSVTCGAVAPMVAGVVYCSVIGACHDMFDLRRAQEWTAALSGWCAAHPDMVPFRGPCLIRRSELLQMHGAWQEAFDEVQRASEKLAGRAGQPDLGAAHYQRAELHRLRGEFEKADEAFRRASQSGVKPYPGLALLRLAEGQIDPAAAAIRRALLDVRSPRARALALRAAVEIFLAARDVPAARSAAEELAALAGDVGAPFLRAASRQASGAVGVSRPGDRFLVVAGDYRFDADNVIVAMGNFQRPRVPPFASQLDPGIVQLHSFDYHSPAQFKDGVVLVVGAGNSGAEIALEAVRGHEIWMAGRDTGHVPFRINGFLAHLFLTRLVLRVLFHRILTIATPIGRKVRPAVLHRGGPLIRIRPSELAAAMVRRVPRVVGVRGGLPLLEDGRVLEVANIVWCTGFNPGFSWIDLPVFDSGGDPRHEGGVVPSEPGLYFVGLHFLYAFSSEMIHGVGRDAARIAEIVARRATASEETAERSSAA